MWANNLKVGFCFCVSIWLVLMIYKSNASKTVENLLNFFSSKQGVFFVTEMNYFASNTMSPYILPLIYQLTVLPSWSSLNWHNPPSAGSSKWNQWKVSMSPLTLTSFLRPLETFRHWHHFYDGWRAMTTIPVKSLPLQYPHAPLQIKRWNLLPSKYPFNRTNVKRRCHKCQRDGHLVKIWKEIVFLWKLFYSELSKIHLRK